MEVVFQVIGIYLVDYRRKILLLCATAVGLKL